MRFTFLADGRRIIRDFPDMGKAGSFAQELRKKHKHVTWDRVEAPIIIDGEGDNHELDQTG